MAITSGKIIRTRIEGTVSGDDPKHSVFAEIRNSETIMDPADFIDFQSETSTWYKHGAWVILLPFDMFLVADEDGTLTWIYAFIENK